MGAVRKLQRHLEAIGDVRRKYYKLGYRTTIDESGGSYQMPVLYKHNVPYYIAGRKVKRFVNHGLVVKWERV